MTTSKRRSSPGTAANSAGAIGQSRHADYNALFREVIGCIVLGAFIGVIVGTAVIGMADSQRLAAQRMKQAASVAEVDHGR